ncbi:MAG: S8 family serine peptidase, partial [Fretibacterium sp.]|nr:S8 family serine peptidase [Fretibacterium sp.]
MKRMLMKMKRMLMILSLLLFLVSPSNGEDHVPGDVLVVFRAGEGVKVTAASVTGGNEALRTASIAASMGGRVTGSYGALSEAGGTPFVRIQSDTETDDELIRKLRARPDVLAVSPNYRVRIADVTLNDPISPENDLWGLRAIEAPSMWNTTTGSPDVCVAVIDSGIDYTNPDLRENVDRSLSRNFTSTDDSAYMDDNGHGSHVAGTIGARGNNGKGVVGVNWNVKLIALKSMESNGQGLVSDIISAIDYLVTKLKADPSLKIAAVNLSLAYCMSMEPTAANLVTHPLWLSMKALDRLNRTVIVVSAGNSGLEVGAPAPTDDPSDDPFYSRGDYIYP